jgi:DNA-binding transcriptional regulator YdaS (Cro superfamily)
MTFDEIIEVAGGITNLGRAAGVDHSTVCGWRRKGGLIPVNRAQAIHATLGIPLHEVRPDVWAPDPYRDGCCVA